MTIYVQHILHVQFFNLSILHLVLLKDRILLITLILLKFCLK